MNMTKVNMLYMENYDTEEKTLDAIQNNADMENVFQVFLEGQNKNLEDENADKCFGQLLEGKSKTFFFIGYKNTGKTSYLKKYFGFKNNTTQLQKQKNRLILPILNTGNVEQITPYQKVVNGIKGICDKLYEEYQDISNIHKDEGIERFFQYILETRGSLLPELDFEEECTMTEIERKKRRISKMQKLYPLSFQLTKLKFYTLFYCTDIKKIIIIIDNLHKLGYGIEKMQELIRYYLEVYECLKNYCEETSDKKISVDLIISVRPITYRQLKTDPQINSYIAANNQVWKSNKIDTVKLFEEMGSKASSDITVDSETVSKDYIDIGQNLYHLGVKFKYKYSNMIEQLCFYDFELLMLAYKKILSNVTWVKEGNFRYSTTNVAKNGLSFTNISCIRALACGNRKLYRNMINVVDADALDCLIPNLLYNTESQNYGIFILYTMKFFLRRFSENMEYGDDYVVLKDYMKCFSEIFTNVSPDVFVEVITYLYKTEILRKSVADIEGANGMVYGTAYGEEIGTDNKMYITSRGRKLWDMLKDDSVLLELCREDMYRERTISDDAMKSSYDLMMEGKQNILFLDLLDIIKGLFEEERGYLEVVCRNKKKELFLKIYGKKPLTLTLLEGVSKSIQYSGCRNVMGTRDKLKDYINTKWNEMIG